MSAEIEHLHLLQHKGLTSGTLVNLGRINVICGPNNSGKTTILECLASEKLHTVGLSPTDKLSDSLFNQTVQQTGWSGNYPPYNALYAQAIKAALFGRDAWFLHTLEELGELVKSETSYASGGANIPTGAISFALSSQFKIISSVVLIPAKRQMDTVKSIQSSEQVFSTGTGILNFLLYARNSDEMSSGNIALKKIDKAFFEITQGYKFDTIIKLNNQVELRFKSLAHDSKEGLWLPASDCGLGLQDLLIILYFSIASNYNVVLIEEAENHLHPDLQRRLLTYLKEKTSKQFFITTHSSVFLNTLFADKVYTCKFTSSVQIENATNKAQLLSELGYSIADNITSDLIILCEGTTDKLILEEFLIKTGTIPKRNIKMWPLGGDIMAGLDLSVFREAYNVLALIDNDPGSSKVRKRFLEICKVQNIEVTQLTRYSIENYFSLKAISLILCQPIPPGMSKLLPKKKVAEQLGFEVKRCGGKIAQAMSLDDISGTDFFEFLQLVDKRSGANCLH